MDKGKVILENLMENFLKFAPEVISSRTLPDMNLKKFYKMVDDCRSALSIDKSINELLDEGKSLHEINVIYKNNIFEGKKYE